MTHRTLSFTKFTSITPFLLSKSFTLVEGKLIKTSSADMSEGRSETITCRDLTEFNNILARLPGSQALSFGIATGHPIAHIRSKDKMRPGDIARTLAHFQFERTPGIMMLDHDSTVDGVPIDAETLRKRLIEAIPALANASMLWRPSASSCISNALTGEVLNGIKGQRLYIPVKDASLIPEAGKSMVTRLWAAGFSWVEVGKAGQALKRTLIDTSVWQANRLDFAGTPELSDELVRTTPASIFFGDPAAFFDLSRIKTDADIDRRCKAAQAKAVSEVKGALKSAREAHVVANAPGLAARRGISVEEATSILKKATDHYVLSSDFELYAQDGRVVTVSDLLNLSGSWDGKNFADPLEPDYGGGNRTVARAYLRAGSNPRISSYAHGGMTYRLTRPCPRIQLAIGQRARVNDEIIATLRDRGDVYDFGEGSSMARVSLDGAVPVTKDWLTDSIDRSCEFYRIKQSSSGDLVEVTQDAPPNAASAIIAKHGERRFLRLEATITAPTLRRDGSVLDELGYDPASGLLYLGDEGFKVPRDPSTEDALQALARLWAPISQFPFVGEEDRGVALAAMITAVLRGTLPTAPGFAFDAPAAGSGKTLLATVIGILATGTAPSISAPASKDEEMRKRLFASLREGAGVILWDNLRYPLGGAAIDSFLTAPSFKDRILGLSETASLPNRAIFLCTGNNLIVKGDTCRRVLISRIDPESETPFAREFTFDPAALVMRQRQSLVVDALTIVRAHITAGSPRLGKGRTASFELWDDLVRQPVVWIAELAKLKAELPSFTDPLAVIQRQFDNDPATQELDTFMTGWSSLFGDHPTTAKKAMHDAMMGATMGATMLHDALEEIANESGRAMNSRTLGRWMERNIGRRHKGRCIHRGKLSDGIQTWSIRKIESSKVAAK